MPAGELMVDGGIMANNPIAMATVEAISELDWPKEDIRVLSVSCLSSPSQVPLSSGALEFLFKNLLDVTSNVASANAIGMSQILLGEYGGSGHKAIHRIDTVVDAKSFSLDATDEINKLKSLGANKGLHEYTKIQDVFFQQTVEPFIPE